MFNKMKINIIRNSHRFGYDIGGCDIKYAVNNLDISCRCVQILLDNKTRYSKLDINSKDSIIINNTCNLLNQTVYIHCPLISNLALPDDDRITIMSRGIVKNQLSTTQYIPTSCVLHIGKRGKSQQGKLEQVGININKTVSDLKVNNRLPLLMENAAGQKNELGYSLEEIRLLFESIDKGKVGICIDTQHSYASGLCEFQTHEQVCKLFDDIESISKIQLFHLNDSNKEYKSRVDRHRALTKGYIWYKNQEGLYSLIQQCFDKSIDMVSETDDPLSDIELIKNYIKTH